MRDSMDRPPEKPPEGPGPVEGRDPGATASGLQGLAAREATAWAQRSTALGLRGLAGRVTAAWARRGQVRAAWGRLPERPRSALATVLLLALLLAISRLMQSLPGGEQAGAGGRPAPAATTSPSGVGSGAASGPEGPEGSPLPAFTLPGTPVAPPAGQADPALREGSAATGTSDPTAVPGEAERPEAEGPESERPTGPGGGEPLTPPPALRSPLVGFGQAAPDRGFGWAYFPATGDWRLHAGLDVPGQPGDPVLAAAAGTVAAVGEDPLWGLSVTLDHGGGWQTRYRGLAAAAVTPGQAVQPGDRLGDLAPAVGAMEAGDGPHLHFELLRGGRPVDPTAALAEPAP
ncbi:MAG: peptidoglycan DD-metalloendopeptidase family protein [Bacillota bacterium]